MTADNIPNGPMVLATVRDMTKADGWPTFAEIKSEVATRCGGRGPDHGEIAGCVRRLANAGYLMAQPVRIGGRRTTVYALGDRILA